MPIDVPAALAAARQAAAAIQAERARVLATSRGQSLRRRFAATDQELAGLVAGLAGDPCDASPQVPLVLLPVRVETSLSADGRTLRVRITPDEIHVDTMQRQLEQKERTAGRAYWTTLWHDSANVQAWPQLLAAVGGRRAAWVAHATRPTNRQAPRDGEPAFADDPPAVAAGSVARCLPDRFVVRVYPTGGAPITVQGAPIAPDVPIAPIALEDDELVDANGMKVPAGSQWTVDFNHAKTVGLGVDVPLQPGVSAIDYVIVTGIRQSVDEAHNATDLADLLTSHRYSDGVSLLPFGTTTNNASADRSPYQPDEPAAAPSLDVAAPSVDAIATATLLGIDAAVLEDLLDASAPRSGLGLAQTAANTALWYATWSPVLARVDDTNIAGVTPATIESARRLHRESVRGAGHCPALRIGAQPYGILPVTSLAQWKPRAGETTAPVVPLVLRLLGRWTARSRTLPHVGPADDVSDAAMLEMMGMQPTSSAVRIRLAVDGPKLSALAAVTGAPSSALDAERQVGMAVLSQYSVEMARRLIPPSIHDRSRLVGLPLVSPRDGEVIAEILADRPAQVDSVLQALLDIAWDTAKLLRGRTAPATTISPLLGLVGVAAEVAPLIQVAAQNAPIAGALANAPTRSPQAFRDAAAKLRAQPRFDGQPVDAPSLAAFEPVAEARTSLGQVAVDLGDTAQARWVGQHALGELLELFAARLEVADAMKMLASASLEERRIAVASALDLASHRVDAWATGIAADRQRTLATGEGMTLGAFGYVENIRLDARGQEPQGWLQAPSGTHAVTAGMLASAHRSNIGAQAGRQPFAIELASRRGPALRRLLEGMRGGQSVGALIGYQIERGLTGSAGRFQLSLRELAPLITDTLGTELPVGERTARVAAASVVDGVALLRQFPADGLDASELRQKLSARPTNTYVHTWDAVTDDEWPKIVQSLKEAAATLDAVSDALLAESVLQYASGNASRASMAMEASANGASLDPELGVLGVRQTSRSLTHAAFAVVPQAATGWVSDRPRAIAEPRLEAWAARRLGAAADVVVGVGPAGLLTLADSGFAALDIVFADDLRSLERDLRAALPALGDAPIAMRSDPAWPPGSRSIGEIATLAATLRSMTAGATPLAPAYLVPPGAAPQHRVDTGEMLGRCDVLLEALGQALNSGADVVSRIDKVSGAIAAEDIDAVRSAVAPLAAFGIPLLPDPAVPTNASWAFSAWQSGSARWKTASTRLAEARVPDDGPLSDKQLLDAATAIAEGILGDGFRMLPLLRHIPTDAGGAAQRNDFADALQPAFEAPKPSQLSAFVRDHATVRAGMGRLAEAQLIGRAFARVVDLRVVQLGSKRDDGGPEAGTERWLAGALADDQPWPTHPVAHVVAELVGAPGASSDNIAGLVFDGWVEALPFRPDERAFAPEAPENPLRAHRATTGLAVQAAQASARAPQVILSAVPADGNRWTTDSVIAAIRSAIDVSKARLVTFENLPGDAAILPAIYVASPWLQPSKGLYLKELATVDWKKGAYPFLAEN